MKDSRSVVFYITMPPKKTVMQLRVKRDDRKIKKYSAKPQRVIPELRTQSTQRRHGVHREEMEIIEIINDFLQIS